jgi:hypothetical protein
MLCISRPAEAIWQPTAFRIRDRRKPAPATQMTEAMTPIKQGLRISVNFDNEGGRSSTIPISAIALQMTSRDCVVSSLASRRECGQIYNWRGR